MPLDAIGGVFFLFAAVVAHAAGEAGPNRISILSVILAVLGAYLIYNGYTGRPSYLEPYFPFMY